ncbi:MAG: cellulase family glycosylhydrolase [Polyangiaceae bacterium]
MLRGLKLFSLACLGTLACSNFEDTRDPQGSAGSGGTGAVECDLPTHEAPKLPRGLHVVGNELHDAEGAPVVLRGVNRSGSEYKCVSGSGIFDGPTDDAALAAFLLWKVNAVRIPLNEACWLGTSGYPQFAGEAYKQAIKNFVARLEANGLVPILELHFAAPGTLPANTLYPMPNADHSPAFWADVATTFSDDDAVVFELYNEPFPDKNGNSEAAWQCWRDGCTSPETSWGGTLAFPAYQAAGMQELVSSVRATGSTHLLLLGGIQYSNNLSRWLAFAPQDPAANIAPAWHVYNFNYCSNATCWDAEPGMVATQLPLVVTEFGQDDCRDTMVTPLLQYLDSQRASYLAWWWYVSPGACVAAGKGDDHGPPLALITNYSCPHPKSPFAQAVYDQYVESSP